ncbi:MAG: hypothetical protein K2W95_26525 [Candidatus Obscuribacterales bacterium]|nr:hypothetical protein [Candidatus Obscuribacterales bacterium]
MSNQTTTASNRELAASAAVREWFDSYLFNIYGISPGGDSHSSQFDSRKHEEISADDFVSRLYARFSELDLAPRDGEVTPFEIERAIANPLLHFDEKDMQMLKLLRRYFVHLAELHKDYHGQPEWGISRHDLDALAHCMTGSALELRQRLEAEYGGT